MPTNVDTAYPMLPTSNAGTTNESQPTDLAKATDVGGPPIALLDATNNR